MKNPSACRPPIAPYMAMTLARSGRVIAPNDRRASRPMRGDASAVAADTVLPFVRSPGVSAVYLVLPVMWWRWGANGSRRRGGLARTCMFMSGLLLSGSLRRNRCLACGASAGPPAGQMVQPCADSAVQSWLMQCPHR